MSTKKILGITVAVLLCVTVYGASNVSAGGSIDVNMGSNMEPTGSGSFNLEYKPLSIFSIGVKASGQTDFEDFFAVTPSVFARLYPFSGAFAEGSVGYRLSWQNSVMTKNMSAGAALGWRITSGNTYIEPKVNFDYVLDAAEPFSWSAGVGAGYNF